mgnify:CR=1 FL=1
MKDIAVILINYNSIKYSIDCINSILDKTNNEISYELILIDNNSKNKEYEQLIDYTSGLKNENVKVIKSNVNLGFGAGNMLGVKYSNANYYAFVNNDSVFINDCLFLLKKAMDNNPNYGICGPKAYKENGSILPTLDYFASVLKEILGRKVLHIINPYKYIDRHKDYVNHQVGQFVSGSFMMIRASDFITVKGFDPNIFLYYEETDLCLRLLKINKKAYLIPEAKFIHYHGASTPKNITIKSELKISLLYVIRKHYGYLNYKILLTYLQIRYFITSFFKPKYWHLFKILFKGAPLTDSMKNKQEYR